jgi:agmatinase
MTKNQLQSKFVMFFGGLPPVQSMGDPPTFLGLTEDHSLTPDIVILPVPYELTTSYGQGTVDGPESCLKASSQVELYDPRLSEDLPAGSIIRTLVPWSSEAGTLNDQLDSVTEYLTKWLTDKDIFPVVLGGEHGLLPAEIKALKNHPLIDGEFSNLTIIQFDAHADLRDELDGDKWSHACAARRSLDLGIGEIIQIGIRAWSREEANFSQSHPRIRTHLASNILAVSGGEEAWNLVMDELMSLSGPVWISVDIDALEGYLVPSTGTPVPGGLSWWHLESALAQIFESEKCTVIGADVVETVPDKQGSLTQFTAAMIATRLVGGHIYRSIQ